LEVYPLPRDKPVLRESLSSISNVVDGGDANRLVFLEGSIIHKSFFLNKRKEKSF